MGTYKVIQDIEAEDKLLGPLSLRQFIYAIIVVVSLFLCFKLVTTPGPGKYFTILFIPHTVFFAVLAAPFGHDQSNEIWLLAKIRFFFKPRKRIWDQTGIKELVTITVPKKIEKHLTKDFSQDEARNRLRALANTLDTRGWAVKHVDLNMFKAPAFAGQSYSDRLIDLGSTNVPSDEEDIITPFDDNYSSTNISQGIIKSDQTHKQQLASIMGSNQTGNTTTTTSAPQDEHIDWFAARPTDAQKQTVGQTIQQSPEHPLPATTAPTTTSKPQTNNQVVSDDQQTQQPIIKTQTTVMTPANDPAIIELANNNDLNISTIARQADKSAHKGDDDEVVISLH